MPYAIRKIGPPSKPYCVVNTETDESKGCSETLADAKEHLAVLNMREHGVEAKGEKEIDMAEIENLLKTPQEVILNKDYLDRLDTFSEAAHAFLGDRAPAATPLPEVKSDDNGAETKEDVEEKQEEWTCECLDCGHTMDTSEHCSDITCPECGGEMRRADRPGVGKDVDNVEQYTGGIEPTPAQKAQGDREKLQSAAESRASKYHIGVKEGGNRTPPAGYPTSESDYGDPVNYRYPADAEHARPALTRFNDSTNRTKGGYTTAEWSIIGHRLARLISRHLPATYQYSDGKLEQKSIDELAEPVEPTIEPTAEPTTTPSPPEFTRVEISKLDQIKLWVKSIFDKLCGTEDNPMPLFITKQTPDGYRWISISSTAFRDREQEIVSMEGVAKSISRADGSGSYGPLLFWHEPITLGTCDFQAQEGVCLIESGLWDTTPVAKAAREGLDSVSAPWGKSIGFIPLAQQEDVIIKGATVRRLWTDLQIVERSILPSSEAASLFTQIQTRGLPMEQKKKDALVELLGDEQLVNDVLAKAAEINKTAESPDAIVKDADTQDPTEESQPTGEEAAQTEDVKTEEKDGNDELLSAIQTLGEQVQSLNTQVKALQEAQSAPTVALHRPTFPSDAAPSDDETEEKELTSFPRVVQAMGSQIMGG